MTEIPLGTRSYEGRSLQFSSQQLVNCYLEFAEDSARSRAAIYGARGLKDFADTGKSTVTGLHVMADELYAVADDRLLKISSTGAPTDLGEIPGSSRPDMAASNNELTVVRDTLGYVWDGNTLDQITDNDFLGSNAVAYIDGFFVHAQPDTQVMFHSNLLDAKTFDPLAFASAEGAEDLLVRPFSDHGDLILAGEKTMEIWGNDGGSPLTFSRRGDSFVERGLAAKHAMAAMDNSFYWLGNDRLFYTLQGYSPTVISDNATAQAVQEMTVINDAFSFTTDYGKHKLFHTVFPTEGKTFVFDSATQRWHERETFGRDRWRANCHAEAYGKHFVGDAFSGKIYELDDQTYTDAGGVLERVFVTPPIHAENRWVLFKSVEVLFDRGNGLSEGQGSDPVALLDYSDEGGRPGTFKNVKELPMGKIGEYLRRAKVTRLGRSRARVFRVRVTDPVFFAAIRMDADMEALAR